MTESGLFFFVGLSLTLAVWRVIGALFPRHATLAGFLGRVAGWVGLAALVGLAAALMIGAYDLQFLRGPGLLSWWTWTVLQHGGELLAGVAAGVILSATFTVMPTLHPASLTAAGIVGAIPALAILALYFVGVPGGLQSLGIAGVKTSVLEFTLSQPSETQVAPPGGTSAVTVGYLSANDEPYASAGYSNYYTTMVSMSESNPQLKPGIDFAGQPYFVREALYSRRVDRLEVPLDSSTVPTKGVALAIWNQGEFIRSLGPFVRCIGFYRLSFPDIPVLRQHIWDTLETLVAIEIESEAIAVNDPRLARSRDRPNLDDLFGSLQDRIRITQDAFKDTLPRAAKGADSGNKDPNRPHWSECVTRTELHRFVPKPGALLPPYLAMFVTNAYAAALSKEAGLEILVRWIAYYKRLRNGSLPVLAEPIPKWLFDRAVLEYGLVQESEKPYPTTSRERYTLERTQHILETDLGIELDNVGRGCGQTTARAADPADTGVDARLVYLYSNVIGRLLHATAETRSSTVAISVPQSRWARQIMVAADRCLDGEDLKSRKNRQIFDKTEGALALARWAEDGQRAGLVSASAAKGLRENALRAFIEVLPLIRLEEVHDKEDTEMQDKEEGLLRVTPSIWEAYGTLVEHEIALAQSRLKTR